MSEQAIQPAGDADLARSAAAKIDISPVGMKVRTHLTYEEWEAAGLMYRFWAGCIQWVLGDWLNYGEKQFGEKYAQAVAETELDAQTLRNYAWVCHKVAPENRDHRLSFSHHAEVAPLAAEDQKSMLNAAYENGWTVRLLRQQVTNLRVDRGLMAPPVRNAADYAEVFERHNLPTPMLNGDPSLGPIAKRLEQMEHSANRADALAESLRQASEAIRCVRAYLSDNDLAPPGILAQIDGALRLMDEATSG